MANLEYSAVSFSVSLPRGRSVGVPSPARAYQALEQAMVADDIVLASDIHKFVPDDVELSQEEELGRWYG